MMIRLLLLYYYLFYSFIPCNGVLFSTVRLSGVRNRGDYFAHSKKMCTFCAPIRAKRSIVASFKAGCVMWALNSRQWTRSMSDTVEWLTWRGIWSVWAVTGDMLQKDTDTATPEGGKTGPANMLDSIEGSSFNEQQLDALRQRLGKPTGAASKKQLSVWSARGFIEYSAQTGMYTKTEAYLKRKG